MKLGVASVFLGVFIRKLKNRSGTTSVQVISKQRGKYKVVKSIGSAESAKGIESLYFQAKQYIQQQQQQAQLFASAADSELITFLESLNNAQVSVIGPELVLGKLYDRMGFNAIEEDLFRHLVIARLSYPGSKLKTIDYLYRYEGKSISVDRIYRFLDKLHASLKEQVEQLCYEHTLRVLKGKISVVFYDMTTLYFEASDEDDLRMTGFSKDGKHQNPQIYLGLLVGLDGWAIGYDIFEGNIYEGHTLIPVLQKFEKRFNLQKPIVVADAGLLSNENIKLLDEQDYEYILGARPKNETAVIQKQILQLGLKDGEHGVIEKNNGQRLIIAYASSRAKKDEYNRQRGLARLEKQIKTGKLTKSQINKRGYNKYLRMDGQTNVSIDYNKFKEDKKWDGIKGYLTQSQLTPQQIIENYKQLWQIEKAFRISKTDLKIRPVYHRLRRRIEAHICIAFTAYSIQKELERLLKENRSELSVNKAKELTQTIYQLNITLPESKHKKNILLKMNEQQQELCKIISL